MFPSMFFLVVAVTLCCSVTSKQVIPSRSSKSGNDVKDHSSVERRKRLANIFGAATFEGMRVARMLLQDAKQIFFSPSGRIYEKPGGFKEALKDFDSTKPRNVQQDPSHTDMKTGDVGDRKITIKEDGWLGNPTVYLIKNQAGPLRAGTIETIIYRNAD